MYEEKKNNKTKTAQEDTADAIRKIVSKMQIEHTITGSETTLTQCSVGWLTAPGTRNR